MNRFVDFWRNLEEQNTRLRTAFYTTLLVAGIEAWGLVTLARVPAPVYVVPGATKSGLYRADETWHEAARDFAQSYALTVANFTPESAARSYETSLRYLAPVALSTARAMMAAELERIRRDRISVAFTIVGKLVSTPHEDRILVAVPGHTRVYAGRELIREQPVTYQLTIALVPATRAYPHGMQVVAARRTETPTNDGKGAAHETETVSETSRESPRG
jgi:TraE protein